MKRIRKTALFGGLSLAGVIFSLWAFVYGPVWYVVNVPTHPAIDETRVGLIKELKKHGYISGKTIDIDIESEGGNLISVQSMEDSKAGKLNKIHVAIGTDIARSVKEKMSPEASLIFSSVTDPVGAGLIQSPEKPEGRVTGVSNFVSTYPQLRFFYTVYPKMKRIGFLYNPNELNSVYILHDVQASAAKLGLQVVLGKVTSPSQVESVAKSMNDVDAFYVNNDNTVASEWGDVVRVADERKIPAFTSDTALIKYGSLAAYGVNQFEVGKATAKMVMRMLKGESVQNIPMVTVNQPHRVLNNEKAKQLGISVTAEMLKEVDEQWPRGWFQDLTDWISSFF